MPMSPKLKKEKIPLPIESAFSGCSGLTEVYWNAENCTKAGTASSPIFDGCTKITTVIIGENVKTIPASAFSGCSGLKSVTIPNSVTSIGNDAFCYCSGLTEINYGGTKAQWNSISKGSYWNGDTGDYTIHCTD